MTEAQQRVVRSRITAAAACEHPEGERVEPVEVFGYESTVPVLTFPGHCSRCGEKDPH